MSIIVLYYVPVIKLRRPETTAGYRDLAPQFHKILQ